jgi:hypothetical protein
MELELLNQLTGTGANSATIIVGYILWRHDLRLRKLEERHNKATY